MGDPQLQRTTRAVAAGRAGEWAPPQRRDRLAAPYRSTAAEGGFEQEQLQRAWVKFGLAGAPPVVALRAATTPALTERQLLSVARNVHGSLPSTTPIGILGGSPARVAALLS